MGILVLLATVQLWNLLHHNARLQVISRTLSRAWDEVTGFLLVILLLLTGYAAVVSPGFRPGTLVASLERVVEKAAAGSSPMLNS